MKVEVLAPAGNIESLISAIKNGADAVYLGLDKYNARANAGNFNLENLQEWVDYCHMYDVRVYLTMNTLIKDKEMLEAVDMCRKADKIGVDAIIAQDLGLIIQLYSTMPHIVLHASTQMGVHNLAGAIALKKIGISRVVLSRETLIKDIIDIRDNCDIEIEFFVQGALCVCFSGNCYFSGLVSGLSGNRGRCLQLCRKKYTLNINDKIVSTAYWLSPSDMMMLDKIEKLIASGVTSLKIEGRMRRAEYVGEATRVYRTKVDSIINNCIFDREDSINNLAKLYNRGNYNTAHIDSSKNYKVRNDLCQSNRITLKNKNVDQKTIDNCNCTCKNLIYNSQSNHIGIDIGYVYKINNNIVVVNSNHDFRNGDGVKLMRNGVEIGSALVKIIEKNTFSCTGDVKINDRVMLTTDVKQLQQINDIQNNIIIEVDILLKENEKAKVKIACRDIITQYESDFLLETARNIPLLEKDIDDCMSKTTNTCYHIEISKLAIIGRIFLTKSQLNSIRRGVLEKTRLELLKNYNDRKLQLLKLSSKNNIAINITNKKYINLTNLETQEAKVIACPSTNNIFGNNKSSCKKNNENKNSNNELNIGSENSIHNEKNVGTSNISCSSKSNNNVDYGYNLTNNEKNVGSSNISCSKSNYNVDYGYNLTHNEKYDNILQHNNQSNNISNSSSDSDSILKYNVEKKELSNYNALNEEDNRAVKINSKYNKNILEIEDKNAVECNPNNKDSILDNCLDYNLLGIQDKNLEKSSLKNNDSILANCLDYKLLDIEKINIMVELTDINQVSSEVLNFCDAIVYNPTIFDRKNIEELIDKVKDKLIILNLPNVIRGEDNKIICDILLNSPIENVVVNNIGHIELTKSKNIIFGQNMNIINCFQFPKILSIEAGDIVSKNDFVYAYGYPVIMTLCHCPIIEAGVRCIDCKQQYICSLTDNMNNTFKINLSKIRHCYHKLINCKPIDISKTLNSNRSKYKRLYYDFSRHDKREIINLIDKIVKNEIVAIDKTNGNIGKGIK